MGHTPTSSAHTAVCTPSMGLRELPKIKAQTVLAPTGSLGPSQSNLLPRAPSFHHFDLCFYGLILPVSELQVSGVTQHCLASLHSVSRPGDTPCWRGEQGSFSPLCSTPKCHPVPYFTLLAGWCSEPPNSSPSRRHASTRGLLFTCLAPCHFLAI